MKSITAHFIDNSGLGTQAEKYDTVTILTEPTIESWRDSLFSFEWLKLDGKFRSPEELGERQRDQYQTVLKKIEAGEKLEIPIIGLSPLEHIEILSKKEVFLTLAMLGHKSVQAHILKSQCDDLTNFIKI